MKGPFWSAVGLGRGNVTVLPRVSSSRVNGMRHFHEAFVGGAAPPAWRRGFRPPAKREQPGPCTSRIRRATMADQPEVHDIEEPSQEELREELDKKPRDSLEPTVAGAAAA